jgi:hypothetical protein
MATLTPLYPDTDALPLLADSNGRYRKLKTNEERADQLVLAELLLNLTEPVFTDRDADQIMYAIALQVTFQMEQGVLTAQMMKSVSTATGAGSTTSYRDRYLHPGAAAIIARVCGRATVGFSPLMGT